MCVANLSRQYKVMSDLFSGQGNNLLNDLPKAVKTTRSGSSYYYYIAIIVIIILLGALLIWYLLKRREVSIVYGPYVLGEQSLGGAKPEKIFNAEQIERSLGNNFTLRSIKNGYPLPDQKENTEESQLCIYRV